MVEEGVRPDAWLQSTVARLIGVLLDRRDALVAELTQVATYESAVDEVQRSVRALAGAPWEIRRNAPRQLAKVTAFLPSNNLLYSYTLFCLIPALYTEQVIARPSARVRPVAVRVHELLEDVTDGRIQLTSMSQRDFVRLGADADAVIFTGQPQNAQHVMAELRGGPLVLSFGSGPNPFVIGPEADVDDAAQDLLTARLYNSGQDCLCPDVTFVHASVADRLVDHLRHATAELAVGDRRDPLTRVTSIVYDDAVQEAGRFLADHAAQVRQGGRVDAASGLVQPSVVDLPWRADFAPPEFFSPVFCVVRYDDARQLRDWFTAPAELARGMYACVYGEPDLPRDRIGTTVVCHSQTTFDIEDGNRPFGGFGSDAACVQTAGAVYGRPLLLSAEARSTTATQPSRA